MRHPWVLPKNKHSLTQILPTCLSGVHIYRWSVRSVCVQCMCVCVCMCVQCMCVYVRHILTPISIMSSAKYPVLLSALARSGVQNVLLMSWIWIWLITAARCSLSLTFLIGSFHMKNAVFNAQTGRKYTWEEMNPGNHFWKGEWQN